VTADLIGKLGYVGIILLLVLGGLGLPVPEEAPILLAAVLSHKGTMWWPIAFPACLFGVLLGDFVVYFLGFFYGEKVLSLPLTRKFLTRAREEQIKGYFHRHGVKILILGRFAVGFRTAAYLTAGILRLPTLKLFLTDLCAASLSTVLMFAAGYWFADRIEAGLRTVQHYFVAILAAIALACLLYRYVKARRRAGRRVGPPILADDEPLPLPPDDLHPAGAPAPAAEAGAGIGIGIEPPRAREPIPRSGEVSVAVVDPMRPSPGEGGAQLPERAGVGAPEGAGPDPGRNSD